MKLTAACLATLVATAVIPTEAHAAVIFSSTAFGLDAIPAGSKLIDFDHSLPKGFSRVGGKVRNVSDSAGAEPAYALGKRESSFYLAANPGDTATILADTGYRVLSFFWGSMDTWNTVSLLDKTGHVIQSYSGNNIFNPADGNQTSGMTNRRVTFTTTESTSAIYGVRFASSKPAFEVDNVAFSAPVPEPATWAMMLVGFGMMGAAMRHRRKSTAVSFA